MKNLYFDQPFKSIGKVLMVTALLISSSAGSTAMAENPFVPGAGGSLPAYTEFTPVAGQVGGFLVYSSIRRNVFWGSGTNPEVNMSFPSASMVGAESVVLQYKDIANTWHNYQYQGNDMTTTGDNFSFSVDGSYTFRVLYRGGTKDGVVSNEQAAPLSSVDTYFGEAGMDESMYITGVMAPWVGRGLKTYFIPKKLSDNSVVEGGMQYQWYRVNPVTYAMTAIPGADSLTYITTNDDIGYKLLARATGNETTVGGFYQMMASMPVVNPDKCFITNLSTTGFTLNLYKSVASLKAGDFTLRDKDWNIVPVTSLTNLSGGSVWRVDVPLTMEQNSYYMVNNSSFWRLCTEMHFGPMNDLMEGVTLDLTASALKATVAGPAVGVITKAASHQLLYWATQPVTEVSVFSLAGTPMLHLTSGLQEGTLSTEGWAPGVYVLRFRTAEGIVIRKVRI